MNIKISVITCTWNSKAFLSESIKSVLDQDYPNIEYIFVDGGSTDGTLEEIASIKKPVTIINDIKGGIANAMNAGIHAATGDVIAHMHSDDYYLQNDVLTKVAEIFERDGNGWLIGRCMFDIDGKLVPESYECPKYSYSALLKRNFVPHAATFVKKAIFDELGSFNKSFRLAMDYEMWLRIGRRYQPAVLSYPLAAFRVHNASATQSNLLTSFNEDFKARFKYLSFYQYPEYALRYLIRLSKLFRRLHK